MSAQGYLRPLSRIITCGLFRAVMQEQRAWNYPAGPPEVSIEGIDPVRILLIGDAPAAGCGVRIHELGLAGHLARHTASRIRRGVVVTVAAQPDASARSTLRGLQRRELDGYDSIVLMLATTDAFCLTSRRSWRRSMTGLVRGVTRGSTASVFVTSVASMHLATSLSPFGRRLTGSHARTLDVETRRVCAQSHTVMIPLDPASDLTPLTYAIWGRRIGEHVAGALRDRKSLM